MTLPEDTKATLRGAPTLNIKECPPLMMVVTGLGALVPFVVWEQIQTGGPHPRESWRLLQLPKVTALPREAANIALCLPRSTSDVGSKTRMAESSGPEPAQLHDSPSFAHVSRGPVSVAQLDQSALNYSGGQEEKRPGPNRAFLNPHSTCRPQHAKPLYFWRATAFTC